MSALTITADDFGLCPEVNAAICLLHDRGIVQRTSFLVNTEHFDSSVQALRKRPALQVAIHLNLTDGRPVLPAREVPSLVGRNGAFRGGRHYGVAARVIGGQIRRSEVRAEWEAQIARAKAAGIEIKHLNGHGHVHLLPPLHGVVSDLLAEFAIPHVRLVQPAASLRGVVFGWWSRGLIRAVGRRRLAVTFDDRILGLGHPGRLNNEHLRDALTQIQDGATELIVHPAVGRNDYHSRWRYDGEAEVRALLSEQTALLLRNRITSVAR